MVCPQSDAALDYAWSRTEPPALSAQDIVARSAKFGVFKRPGHRVLINRRGDMLVRGLDCCFDRLLLPWQTVNVFVGDSPNRMQDLRGDAHGSLPVDHQLVD